MKGFLTLLVLLLLSGCGDLLSNKVVKKEIDTSQFTASCNLDINAFKNIMTENISSQIRCLGENLNLFIRLVKSGRKGYMERAAFEAFLLKNPKKYNITPEMLKALKAVYDLNYLIVGEDPEYISKANVDQLVDFAIFFNAQASLNFGFFSAKEPISYTLHQSQRARLVTAAQVVVNELGKIYKPERGDRIDSMNIVKLLDSFSNDETEETINKIKKVLFVKKVLVGGEDQVITHVELNRLISNLDRFAGIGLDAVKYKYIQLRQDTLLDMLSADVSELNDIVLENDDMGNRDRETFFTIDEAMNVVKVFAGSGDFDVEKYRTLITEVKKIVMGGNDKVVKGADFRNLVNHARSLLNSGVVYHRIYKKFQIALDSPLPVTIDFSDYHLTYPNNKKELAEFERIVKNYRFMKGEFLSAYYTWGYRRNPSAVFEISLYEYMLKLLFKTYGSKSPNKTVGGYSMNPEQVTNVVMKFENELIELGLILPQRAKGIADNISLLGTLFQYQSDNNGLLDTNEGTEFALSLMTSFGVADDVMKFFRTRCSPADFDSFDRVSPQCFRENFFQAVCQNHRSYMPLMFDYIGASSASCDEIEMTQTASAFLESSDIAARGCRNYTDGAKEEIFLSKGDLSTLITLMFHIETTTFRWDENRNNTLDSWEMDRAYSIYKPALDGFMENQSAIVKKFQKQIYQYLIKYEKVPDAKQFGSVLSFVKFLVSFNKAAPASRKTMASILAAIGEENKKMSAGQPQFDCNYLRDPTNIPRTPKP